MPVFTESKSSAAAEQVKLRKPSSQINQEPFFSTETDPNPHIPTRPSKSAISSLFLLPFSTNNAGDTNPTTTNKKKGSTFRGLGCTAGAAEQVSVPGVIRSSAEWEGKRVKKKKNQQKHKRKKDENNNKASHQGGSNSNSNNNNSQGKDDSNGGNGGSFNPGSCMVIQDVWCGPGIGLSADPVVGSVDCVAARRNVPGRGKIDNGEKIIQRERERECERERERGRERSSCLTRRAAVNPETLSFLDTDPAFPPPRLEPEVFGTRYYRHLRHPSPDGFAEIMMLQNRIIMGGRLDRFREWRLDIDHMSYEELLALGDRIGYVCTGLKEDEISHCISKIKVPIINELSSHKSIIMDKKCSICQVSSQQNLYLHSLILAF
uniref:RING-type E3 ubiquitin transferase n=1 Tax=Rhizophora mucronata TaxID=61149 RepID=A0A2P2KB25_RHIMU